MDEKQAMDMFERGEAVGVYLSIIVMEAHGRIYFSHNGHEWFESDHKVLKECIDGVKKIPGE